MKKLLLISALAITLAACGDRIKPEDDMSSTNNSTGNQSGGGATAGGINSGNGYGGTSLEGGKLVSYEEAAINDVNNVLAEKIVYFGFDSNEVADDYIELVKHHGKYLSFNVNASVKLEGHADERGTREYNIALAERRALSVQQIMLYEGASKDQISVVSFGEEKPMSFGHDDESMSLNRRVELIYQ